jgi:hypothetical protein
VSLQESENRVKSVAHSALEAIRQSQNHRLGWIAESQVSRGPCALLHLSACPAVVVSPLLLSPLSVGVASTTLINIRVRLKFF